MRAVAWGAQRYTFVVEDRSQVLDPSTSATAVILAPDGSIVKESWVIDTGSIWSNVASYQGGFCVRVNGALFFHDNSGKETGIAFQNDDLPLDITFDGGRGDATRIAAHINSPYVFLAVLG